MNFFIGVRNALIIYAIIILGVIGCRSINVDEPPWWKPDPKPPPAPAIQDAIDPGVIHWMGPNYSGAKIEFPMGHTVMDADWIYYGNAAPSHWPKQGSDVVVQGIACLFYEHSGRIVGGKFEWVRPGQALKSLNNVKEGYGGHYNPQPGAKAYACIVSIDGKFRSNIVEVERK